MLSLMMQSSSNEQLNEIKTQLITREGLYRLIPHAEYNRPKTTPYPPPTAGLGTGAGAAASTPVRISFTKVATSITADTVNNAGGGNPFGPVTFYTRLSQSTEALNNVGGAGSANVTAAVNSNHSSSNVNYLNHHSNSNNSSSNEQASLDHSSSHPHATSNGASNSITSSNNGDKFRIDERICFNIGREIFIFAFNGLQPADLTKLVDRRSYKATSPTCHDICSNLDIRLSLLLVGFNAGQIQLIDLYRADVNKFYNQERLIEKSKVTCIRWLPRSKSNFLVSYASGQMYLFKEDLTCGTTAPNYQQFKSGEGFTIFTCKTKSTRNPIFRWSIGEGAIHEFAFSPCGEYLATVSQDGFLRIFHYDRMELLGRMRSYFGGLLCVGWSPDSRFVVTGGEDDLITVWSQAEKRVIARGQGHKSWVNVVTFDPYMTTYNAQDSVDQDSDDIMDDDHSLEDGMGDDFHHRHNFRRRSHHDSNQALHHHNSHHHPSKSVSNEFSITSYRIGSVGQDTQICLWDLTDDIIRQSNQQQTSAKSRCSLVNTNTTTTSTSNLTSINASAIQDSATDNGIGSGHSSADSKYHQTNGLLANSSNQVGSSNGSSSSHNHHHHHHNSAHQFFNSLIKSSSKSEHKHHKTFSLSSRSFSDKHAKQSGSSSAASTTSSSDKAHHHHQNSSVSSNSVTGSHQQLTNCTGSLGSSHGQWNHQTNAAICDTGRLLGTVLCPRLDDVPMLEPHVCKKVSHERLTSLCFRKDYFVIANQDGKITIYARPNKLQSNLKISSPNASLASDVNEIACDDNSSAIV